jgi:uncharacterized Zn finger protein
MPQNKLSDLTESIIRAMTTPQSFSRRQELDRAGAISNAARQGKLLTTHCEGTSEPYYSVSATLDDAGMSEANCFCEYESGGYCSQTVVCEHIVALLLTYIHKPSSFVAHQASEELLKELMRE